MMTPAIPSPTRMETAPVPNFNPPMLFRNLKRRLTSSGSREDSPRNKRPTYPSWDEISSFNPSLESTLSVNLTRLMLTSDLNTQALEDDSSPVLCGQPIPCKIVLKTRISPHTHDSDIYQGSSDTQKAYIQRLRQGERVSCKIISQRPCQIDFQHTQYLLREPVYDGDKVQSLERLKRDRRTSWPSMWVFLAFYNSADCDAIHLHLERGRDRRVKISQEADLAHRHGAFVTEATYPNHEGHRYLPMNFWNYPKGIYCDDLHPFSMPDLYKWGDHEDAVWSCAVDIEWTMRSLSGPSHPSHDDHARVGAARRKMFRLSSVRSAPGFPANREIDMLLTERPLKHSPNKAAVKKGLGLDTEIGSVETTNALSIEEVSLSLPAAPITQNSSTEAEPDHHVNAVPSPRLEEERDTCAVTSNATDHTTLLPPKSTPSKKRSTRPEPKKARTGSSGMRVPHSKDPVQVASKHNAKVNRKSLQRNDTEPEIQQRAVQKSRSKRYKVPPVPEDVTFFRSFSRRPIESGEYLSESDNDVNESWLKQLHTRSIDKLAEPSAAEKRFMKLFDFGLFDSQPTGDSSFAEYLKIFTNCYREILKKDEELSHQFFVKATTLILEGVISHEIFEECLRIIDDNEDIPERSIDKLNIIETIDDTEDATDKPWMLACTCGDQATSVYNTILCSNIACTHREYHLKCVGLKHRPDGWVCDTCKHSKRRSRKG